MGSGHGSQPCPKLSHGHHLSLGPWTQGQVCSQPGGQQEQQGQGPGFGPAGGQEKRLGTGLGRAALSPSLLGGFAPHFVQRGGHLNKPGPGPEEGRWLPVGTPQGQAHGGLFIECPGRAELLIGGGRGGCLLAFPTPVFDIRSSGGHLGAHSKPPVPSDPRGTPQHAQGPGTTTRKHEGG